MTEEHLNTAEEGMENKPVDEAEPKDWEAEAQKYHDLYMRAAAEMENIRRRYQKDKEEHAKFSTEKIMKNILPVIDNLERALSYVAENSSPEVLNLAEGVKMTKDGLFTTLCDSGLCLVESGRGQNFDPHVHEAMGQLPEEEIPAGTISQEIQKGYTLHERLLRPAKVMVAMKKPD